MSKDNYVQIRAKLLFCLELNKDSCRVMATCQEWAFWLHNEWIFALACTAKKKKRKKGNDVFLISIFDLFYSKLYLFKKVKCLKIRETK